jgi:hypothetical protein
MQFYIELSNFGTSFRLQNDGSWKSSIKGVLSDDDYLTHDYYEFIRIQQFDTKINIEGKAWTINPEIHTFGDKTTLTYDIFVQRSIFPNVPSREELVSVMKNGNDKYNNSLILNVFGNFELRSFHNITIEDPTIIVRNETFGAENEYVGPKPAQDNKFIDELYAGCLEGWLKHLQTGETGIYCDNHSKSTPEELIERIKKITK